MSRLDDWTERERAIGVPEMVGEAEARNRALATPDLVECAICGDYSAGGVEVHEVCLAMLSRQFQGQSPDKLMCGQCGEWLRLEELEGHLASEGTDPASPEPGYAVDLATDVRERLLIRDKADPRGLIRHLTEEEWALLDGEKL